MRPLPFVRSRVALVLAIALGACQGPTGVGERDARFNGTWDYQAEQAGSTDIIMGRLLIDGADIGQLDGSLDAERVDALGGRTAFPGLVSGRVTTSGVARIELTVSGGRVRTHLAQLRGDSLVGDWVESGNATRSGRFTAVRVTP